MPAVKNAPVGPGRMPMAPPPMTPQEMQTAVSQLKNIEPRMPGPQTQMPAAGGPNQRGNSQVPFTQAQLNEQAKFASATPKMGGPNQIAMSSSGLGSNPMPPAGAPNQRVMSFSGLAGNPMPPAPRPGFAKGGSVGDKASKRADGCAQRGKTKGKFV